MIAPGSASRKGEVLTARMRAAVISFRPGSSSDWTSMVRAELTAEWGPACAPGFNLEYRR